ncbi:transmembrane protein 217 [Tupaia chinensis]|uniref:Transmembrane protein 217 n=1 Tax=Tupaia chinensis TaxID=246437 RepID=L9KTU1_TUPCH|nr:transmembrane protein 217 [Tupaia chinensis]XP_014443349.1 transmembrane protein 217 [Tupaia chinensis]XP_014443350.1 transmembrane protein 217 [Tupaia chinensis]ELW66108.1 Transmembrane protein 217 [Tupaia chinensis]
MNAKVFSFMAGIFSILSTIQFCIIDLNQVTYVGYEDRFNIYTDTKSKLVSWILAHKYTISIVLSTTTILISYLLLCCIHRNTYPGLLVYALWIIVYELMGFSMVLLTNGIIKEQFRELSYLHLVLQISRMLLHFGCLPCIVKYAYAVYKDPKITSKTEHRRHSSISTVDSWTPITWGTFYRKLT